MNNLYIDKLHLSKPIPDDSYLKELPVIKHLMTGEPIKFEANVVFFVGENGTGKSTMLEAIAVYLGMNAEGGSKNHCFSTKDTVYTLADCLTISRKSHPKDYFFLRSESFFNVATNVDELGVSGYGQRSLHEQSHGESFLSLFLHRFRGHGLYVLDEPEAALSPMRQMSLITRMHDLVKSNSQFIIATHSPILLAYPGAIIYELSNHGIQQVEYKDTEIYQIYTQFLACPQRMLKHLVEEE